MVAFRLDGLMIVVPCKPTGMAEMIIAENITNQLTWPMDVAGGKWSQPARINHIRVPISSASVSAQLNIAAPCADHGGIDRTSARVMLILCRGVLVGQ